MDTYWNRPKYRKLKQPDAIIKPKMPAIEYLQSRGISEQTAAHYQITVQKEKPNILVFPFLDDNGVMQFVKYRKTNSGAGGRL